MALMSMVLHNDNIFGRIIKVRVLNDRLANGLLSMPDNAKECIFRPLFKSKRYSISYGAIK